MNEREKMGRDPIRGLRPAQAAPVRRPGPSDRLRDEEQAANAAASMVGVSGAFDWWKFPPEQPRNLIV